MRIYTQWYTHLLGLGRYMQAWMRTDRNIKYVSGGI